MEVTDFLESYIVHDIWRMLFSGMIGKWGSPEVSSKNVKWFTQAIYVWKRKVVFFLENGNMSNLIIKKTGHIDL